MRYRASVVLLLGVALLFQGCLLVAAGAGAGAGVGAVAYVRGELQTTYPAPLDRAWSAALGAVKDLQMSVSGTTRDALGGTIDARRADGTAVKVILEAAGPETTAVKIRVGILGDEAAAKTIHRKIAERLGLTTG